MQLFPTMKRHPTSPPEATRKPKRDYSKKPQKMRRLDWSLRQQQRICERAEAKRFECEQRIKLELILGWMRWFC